MSSELTGTWRTGGVCNEYRAVKRSIAEIGGDAWWPEGQFRRDASRESKPVGSTLAAIPVVLLHHSYMLDARRFPAREMLRRLCVSAATTGNPLNNYPNSIRNHATCRTVAPSLGRLTSLIRDIIPFKPFRSIFCGEHNLLALAALYVCESDCCADTQAVSLRLIAKMDREHVCISI